jgi:phosphopantetheine--protein transferase-like protein
VVKTSGIKYNLREKEDMNEDKSTINPIAIGLDIENTERFRQNNLDSFILRTFSDIEINYCTSQKDPAPHFCARFAAKEAAVKAFSQLGIKLPVNKMVYIENNEKGLPGLVIDEQAVKPKDKEIIKDFTTKVSLTHTKEIGAAVVLVIKQ